MMISSWIILIGFGIVMWFLSPRLVGENKIAQFFKGKTKGGKEVSVAFLTASLLISWIFAKSIQNTAALGMAFGTPGVLAYSVYWLSFIVAGFSILRLRKEGFKSIHEFISSRFGQGAVILFSLILVFRLWNEIWSNTIVVGMFFGEQGSSSFYVATWAASGLVLAYSLKSGFRSSIITDVVQMALAAILLIVILGFIFPQASIVKMVLTGEWSLKGCVDLILVALIQIWSYPFHDPVMTDRGFLTEEKKMLKSFCLAGVFGVLLIYLFGFLGLFNQVKGIGGNPTIDTAMALGGAAMLVMNGIMLTSTASTLDSTFTSIGKLISIDVFKKTKDSIYTARISMIVLAVLGGLMVHANPTILSATTVSGTMVIGLAPVFMFSTWKKPGAASFYFSVLVGLVCGTLLAFKQIPYTIGDGKYGSLLWINAIGTVLSFIGYVILAYFLPRKERS